MGLEKKSSVPLSVHSPLDEMGLGAKGSNKSNPAMMSKETVEGKYSIQELQLGCDDKLEREEQGCSHAKGSSKTVIPVPGKELGFKGILEYFRQRQACHDEQAQNDESQSPFFSLTVRQKNRASECCRRHDCFWSFNMEL